MPSSEPFSSDRQSLTYAPGDVIAGKYALEALLGSGGMGAVFRARNTLLDMPVAIKLIRADLDRELLSGRLLQEARAAAKLSHPAIVRVFDVGKTALGDPFIVMELLQGESLSAVLEREGRLSSARAVQVLLPIADALSVAHAKGFVHRDVKPDNVFIVNDEEGQLQPKLVDFGIVKEQHASADSQLTQVGSVMGSPDYMSPEQARGLDTIDLRSDVWSFAVVLYETISGLTPFESTNYNALLRMIVETEPLTLRDRHAADDELSRIVARGLSKDPSGRFATMGQMGKALAAWLHDQGISEDVAGVSLEARWLSRATDPTAAAIRVSRSSAPDSWPEPPSGVRAVSSKLGNAPTLPLARHAATPAPLESAPPEPSRDGRRRYLFGAAALTVAALLVAWFGLGAPNKVHEPSQSPPATREVSVLPQPIVAPPPTSVIGIAPAVSAAEPPALASSLEPTAAPKTKASPRGGHAPKAPAPVGASPIKSDLISPY